LIDFYWGVLLIGSFSSLELRLWNATLGFVLISLATSVGVVFLLFCQLFPRIRQFRTKSTHAILHTLNILTLLFILGAVLMFLRINEAISEDYGSRCNASFGTSGTGFGVCDEFSGSVTNQQLKYQTFYYTYNESWGPLMGYWTALTSAIWSIPTVLLCVVYSYVLSKNDPYSSYEQMK